MNSKIAIIGAGASGLICAIVATRLGKDVTIFEQNSNIGKKLKVTGNGRCNISNENLDISNYQSGDIDMVSNILKNFDISHTKNFFNSIGLELTTDKKKFRLYPKTLQAKTVINLLQIELDRLNISVKLSSKIKTIKIKNNHFELKTSKNIIYSFDKVVIATGSKASSKLGSNSSGYILANQLKHNITDIYPSLVALKSDFKYLKQLSGIKIDAKVTLLKDGKIYQQTSGDLLFTRYGLSGLAILELSRFIKNCKNIAISIDLFENLTTNEVRDKLQKRAQKFPHKSNKELLIGFVNNKLIDTIDCLSKGNLDKMAQILKNFTIDISDTKGWSYCEVAVGGVDMKDIDEKTMQSKKIDNLYFCGEVLDVDGNCGGYNLQFAWSSGAIVGKNI